MENKLIADRYVLGEVIGRGGMAEVHLGTDNRLNRKVAIKVLKKELADDPIFLERFRREAQAAASLNHPSIVSVYDSGEDENVPYIVMEFVEGKTLKEILTSSGRLSTQNTIEVMQGILSALTYSHKVGIIHRDIKPGNVMITSTGAIKVMDFGIARAASETTATLSSTQGVVGTAQYLSPEQARGEVVDNRSDLYSAGCLLFELLTGRPPFVGDTPVSIAYQHVQDPAPLVTQLNPEVPEVFNNLVQNALAKDVNLRYSNAEEFLADLNKAAAGIEVQLKTNSDNSKTVVLNSSEIESLQAFVPTSETGEFDFGFDSEEPALESSKNGKSKLDPKKKRIIIIAAIAAGVILLITLIAILILSSNKKEKPLVEVPAFAASTTKERACQRIEQLKLVCEVQDDSDSAVAAGNVSKTDPVQGTQIQEGQTVIVYISTGPADGVIPDITSMTVEEAKKALTEAGYKVATTHGQDCAIYTGEDKDEAQIYAAACKSKKDAIIGTTPAIKSNAKKGSSVTIYQASGDLSVPDLKKKTKDEVNEIASKLNVKVEFNDVDCQDNSIEVGSVCSQDPIQGLAKMDTTLKVNVAKEKLITLDDYKNTPVDVAKAKLEALGFIVEVSYLDPGLYFNGMNENFVWTQVPDAAVQVEKGTSIRLFVVRKPNPTPTPSTTTSKPASQ